MEATVAAEMAELTNWRREISDRFVISTSKLRRRLAEMVRPCKRLHRPRPYYHWQFLFVNSCLHCLILQEIRIVLGNLALSYLF
jgi:hypothetical protein